MRLMGVAPVVAIVIACDSPRGDTNRTPDSGATSHYQPPVAVRGLCCSDTDTAATTAMRRYEAVAERDRPVELAVWPYRMSSGLSSRERIVVRDSASWVALWPRIVGSHSPVPVAPVVDFRSEMLIVASSGTRATGGHIVVIDSVLTAGDSLRVVVREQAPGPRCGTPAVLSTPASIARVDRSDLPVVFTTREVVRDCA
jgi:hypothetical protein